jgi:hypothetical protein
MDSTAIESNTSQLDHLKIVGLLGFSAEDDQLLQMELLLEKAIVLNSMIVMSPTNRLWRVVKVPLSQLKQEHQQQIAVLSPNKNFLFGFTEEIFSALCSTKGWPLLI